MQNNIKVLLKVSSKEEIEERVRKDLRLNENKEGPKERRHPGNAIFLSLRKALCLELEKYQ